MAQPLAADVAARAQAHSQKVSEGSIQRVERGRALQWGALRNCGVGDGA
ncbi:MAG: hypothetical protein QOH43_3984 [Solirubrobacteraceae bacterium]|jgi:hypothetical protein|nr:hypothetical protein [Solirubrobacteraceae bacterium]